VGDSLNAADINSSS